MISNDYSVISDPSELSDIPMRRVIRIWQYCGRALIRLYIKLPSNHVQFAFESDPWKILVAFKLSGLAVEPAVQGEPPAMMTSGLSYVFSVCACGPRFPGARL